ncbi:hypothetical protein RMATCC62417_08916 [Rhizopus microsporus]|nr:hypothetical protein RMATCC62417_08916 [Rhizopus microsporus]
MSNTSELTREPEIPKDFADIVDDAEIWAVDPGISIIFTAVDSTGMNVLELQTWKSIIIYVVTILLQEDEKNTKSVI